MGPNGRFAPGPDDDTHATSDPGGRPMNIHIRLDTDDANLQDDFAYEATRILREAIGRVVDQAERQPDDQFSFNLFDTNGNKVGHVEVC